jgi:DNA-binding beta-propeller fold protein YncE
VLPFLGPSGVAVDTAGNRALVTDSAQRFVVAVNLDTGMRTVIAADGVRGLWFPFSVAVDAATRTIVTGDVVIGAVHVLDPATGTPTLASDGTRPRAEDPLKPRGIAVDGARRVAWVTNDAFAIPQLVDLVTGERVFLSR